MSPLHIIVRALFAYVFVLIFTRLSGHRTVRGADAPSFVVALIIGDMFDDLFWGEVAASQFVVAVGTLFLLEIWTKSAAAGAGVRAWQRQR
jgi:uncharacterized membrane protein YcaP (DUF421 family)